VAAAGALVAATVVAVVVAQGGDEERETGGRPNIIVIMTDDQTLESMRVLPATQALLADQGTSFTDFIVSDPVCCPSRATYLTGRYAHNNGVVDNVPPDGGFARLDDAETLPVWLQRAGYWTASVGKYLNGWGSEGDIEPPPGWDRWYGLIDPTTYSYFGFEVSDDGERVTFPESAYSTDTLATEVVRIIGARAGADEPFFLSFTPLAPHVAQPEDDAGTSPSGLSLNTPEPPPRHAGRFDGEPLPEPPSFDQADVSGLAEEIQVPRLSSERRAIIENFYQRELETLLSIDEAVQSIVSALAATGELDSTVIVYTSDNGFFHGEHRIPLGKFFLYEPAIHVPLIVRGGPFEAGAEVSALTANVDLAPTILDLAGAQAGRTLDGRSLVPLAETPTWSDDRAVLLENQRRGRRSLGVRTSAFKLIEYPTGEQELYDLRTDPDEMTNLVDDPAYGTRLTDLERLLTELDSCAGADCGAVALPPSSG
jgi:arylsulfatase A-like enzyme